MTCAVKLISITRGAGELEGKTAEEIISYAARVSSPENQTKFETAPRLLRYCLKEKHFSVFETSSMTLEITTSRAIADQLLRHRSATFQQHSQRYSPSTTFVKYPARRQDNKNRQNSIPDISEADQQWFSESQQQVWDLSYSLYQEALRRGIAKECARFLLPLSSQSRLYMTMNVRSWIHYIELRTGNGTQQEHKDIAEAAKSIFISEFPNIAAALEWTCVPENNALSVATQ